mgnify:CR=1 FL=1
MMLLLLLLLLLMLMLVDRWDLAIVDGSQHGVLSTGRLSARAAPRPTDRLRWILPSVTLTRSRARVQPVDCREEGGKKSGSEEEKEERPQRELQEQEMGE